MGREAGLKPAPQYVKAHPAWLTRPRMVHPGPSCPWLSPQYVKAHPSFPAWLAPDPEPLTFFNAWKCKKSAASIIVRNEILKSREAPTPHFVLAQAAPVRGGQRAEQAQMGEKAWTHPPTRTPRRTEEGRW